MIQLFDIGMHCKIITITKLIHISITLPLVGEGGKNTQDLLESISFPVYNTVSFLKLS